MDFKEAMKNPARQFASPEAVKAAADLDTVQKLALLRQWKDQLQQLLVATEENMPGPETSSGVNSECLRRIVDALSRLDPQGR
jgi:hypothetical protein